MPLRSGMRESELGMVPDNLQPLMRNSNASEVAEKSLANDPDNGLFDKLMVKIMLSRNRDGIVDEMRLSLRNTNCNVVNLNSSCASDPDMRLV